MDPIPLLLGSGARGNEWGVEEGEPAPTFLPPQNHGASDEVPFSCGGKRRGRRPLVPQSMRPRREGARWGGWAVRKCPFLHLVQGKNSHILKSARRKSALRTVGKRRLPCCAAVVKV